MKKLQMEVNGEWKFVFCYNERDGVITTDNKSKAIPKYAIDGESDLEYFSNKYGNNVFRLAE